MDEGVEDPGAGDPGAGDPGAGDPGAGDPGAGVKRSVKGPQVHFVKSMGVEKR